MTQNNAKGSLSPADAPESGSLSIRLMTCEDLPLMVKWLSDPRVLKFYEGRDYRATLVEVTRHFDTPPESGGERVIHEWNGLCVGYGQLYRVLGEMYREYDYPDHGECVYAADQFIGEPEYWDRGIGTLYLKRVCDHLRAACHADAVILDPHKNNPRAIRCYEKAGFRILRELPAHELFEGTWVDCFLMEKRL